MPDYANGKIYKITSGDKIYIGSTCEPTLAKRLVNHVKSFKEWKRGKRGSMTSFPLLETGHYEITLIELCSCGSKDELTARERYWIETVPCVNKVVPGRSHKEYSEIYKEWHREIKKEYREANKTEIAEQGYKYYDDNKEAILEKHKLYWDANKDKINEKRRLARKAKKELT
jgi:hypothetical protein